MTILIALIMLPITASTATLIGAVLAPRPAIGLVAICIGSAFLAVMTAQVIA